MGMMVRNRKCLESWPAVTDMEVTVTVMVMAVTDEG